MTTRQQMACGYEARIASAQPWTPVYWVRHGLKLQHCPGYTTTLPEVGEVIDAFPHWEAGTLSDLLDGARAPGALLRALVSRRAGLNEHMDAKRTEAS